MEALTGKIATIAVNYLYKDKLLLGDLIEILDQREEKYELRDRRLAIKVKSLKRPEMEKWIWASEVVFAREKKE